MNHDILVKVGADVTNFSKEMSKTTKLLSNFGKTNKGIFDAFKRTGDFLTKSITVPAVAATSALAGITLVKGFNRLVGIDTARAKLTALGHDAESVEVIMNNALESVKGTSFGLDEAATAAASAVAAGIQPGKELAKYLTLVGDSAAIAGTDFNEMASIFNKVQTAQRAYTGDLNMLADRGIPIYQWLAEEAGTSAEAIRDMASRGEVSAEMFRQAIDKNIGGAAKTIGEQSFMAALKNIGADIARIGASFLDAGGEGEGFFSTLKPLMTEFREYLSTLEDKAAELGKKFGETFVNFIETLRNLKASYDNLNPSIQNVIKYVTIFGSIFLVALGPILKFIAFIPSIVSGFSAIITGAKLLGTAIAGINLPITLIVAAIIGLAIIIYKYWDEIKEFTINTWNAIKEFFANLWDSIVEVFTTAYNWINEKTGGAFGEYVSLIQSYLTTAWEIIKSVWEFIKNTFSNALAFLKALIKLDFSGMKDAMSKQMQNSRQLLSNIWQAIKNNIGAKLKEILSNLISRFTSMVSNAKSKATEILSAVRQKFEQVKKAIKDKLADAVRTVAEKIGEMPGKVIEFVSDMVSSGKDLVQGLIDGIKNMSASAIEAITGVVDGVINKAKSLLKISSPSRLFKQYGKWTGEGLADGITQSIRTVERASERMIDAIMPERKEIDLSYVTPNGIKTSLASAVSGTVDVNARDDMIAEAIDNLGNKLENLRIEMDRREFGRVVSEEVTEQRNESVRGGGRRRIL